MRAIGKLPFSAELIIVVAISVGSGRPAVLRRAFGANIAGDRLGILAAAFAGLLG